MLRGAERSISSTARPPARLTRPGRDKVPAELGRPGVRGSVDAWYWRTRSMKRLRVARTRKARRCSTLCKRPAGRAEALQQVGPDRLHHVDRVELGAFAGGQLPPHRAAPGYGS